ncbi:hypothetical protein AB1Y20_005416 [Prymnesium parvum]|uniref:Fe2OG dioxygenase domain-containing protein n=1 Tax=Prymnesium parvum TaxID=97485 RepID=A0AB34J424_PRYPA
MGLAAAAATLAVPQTAALTAAADGSPHRQPRRLAPVELDLRLPEPELRRQCVAALAGSLTPVLSLRHHGLEGSCAELAAHEAARHALQTLGDDPPSQLSFELEESARTRAVREGFRQLSTRLLRILAGDAAAGVEVEGRLSLRVYPHSVDSAEPVRLGPHCDSTLFTLLWSTAPGLQVLDPDRADGWTPRDVLQFGLPSICDEAPELRDDQWATVEMPWSEGAILLSLGTDWHTHGQLNAMVRCPCAVLHRVAVSDLQEHRLSLPYLVDLASPHQTDGV